MDRTSGESGSASVMHSLATFEPRRELSIRYKL